LGKSKVRVYPALRELYEGFVGSDGSIGRYPSKKFKRVLSERQLNLLVDILKVVMETDFINEESKKYIRNRFITIEGINEEMRDESGEDISLNTTVSKVMYGKKKIETFIGDRFFVDIIANENIGIYEERVSSLKVKIHGKSEYRKNLGIKIPVYDICKEISEEDFNNFVATIAPYSKRQMKFVEDSLDEDACGYFNFLVSENNLVGVDRDRALILESLLLD